MERETTEDGQVDVSSFHNFVILTPHRIYSPLHRRCPLAACVETDEFAVLLSISHRLGQCVSVSYTTAFD